MECNRKNKEKIIIRCSGEKKAELVAIKESLQVDTWLEMVELLISEKEIGPPKVIIQDDMYLMKILTELRRIGNNLNQLTRHCNTNKAISVDEVKQLKKLATSVSRLKNKVITTFVVKRAKKGGA
ncbi:plasmid mobilization relaxosome protein MobC [Psychromonas ossibalaenae]|uniref:plasmid mobilization relaxosome protein MobC n=1 Tax=Psychromonas ossibalaenae TaxID=444922 RepID=UPI00035F78B0|nr:plasmid mobilization relaxosome protein MobC [Psychromonas ossibalaenae]